MIFVKLGCAMAVGVSHHMPAHVPCRMQSALSVKDMCGTMVDVFSAAHSAQVSCVRTISLSIKRHARSWNLRISNVSN